MTLICALLAGSGPALRPAQPEDTGRPRAMEKVEAPESPDNMIILPRAIPDPIEPVNRGLWSMNEALMHGVVQPVSRAYRFIVREPLRSGIRNAGRNLDYPRKLLNNLLQGKWSGARDETSRFLCNSVLGLGGLFDVATRWDIPEWEADFGETFGLWGWKPRVYLMLPILGPSNERDALGALMDRAVNPITYFQPYSYIPPGITYNNLSGTVDEYVRKGQTDFDPYFVLRYAWTLQRENRPVDLSFEGEQDTAALDTLQSVFFTHRDPKFPRRGKRGLVLIPETGRNLQFTYWHRPGDAPRVYVVPGLGSHRLSNGTLGLAELLHDEGFSVVSISSAYNYEFMLRASSSAMPGYVPGDARDLHRALTRINRQLESRYRSRPAAHALLGYSMGGFHSLHLAGTEQTNSPALLQFDRYVAINTPVRLTHAMSQLDDFFHSALAWPPSERTERIEHTLLKVAELAKHPASLTPDTPIPFSALESRFLIGLAFRLSLRDVIFVSQMETDQGVLQQPVNYWKREPVYRDILQYSFADYLDKFLIPYYQTLGLNLLQPELFEPAVDLRYHTAALQTNKKIRIIENSNDFLLADVDLAWLTNTFAPDRLILFERGGHLGNLNHPAVQRAIIGAVADLKKGKGK